MYYPGGIKMKLKEILADYIANSDIEIFEMATERKYALHQIRSLQFEIIQHLLKILALESPNSHNHWIGELNAWLFKIDDIYLKPNNRKFAGDVYYNILFDEPIGHGVEAVTKMLNRITIQEYPNTPRNNLNDYQIYEKIEDILRKVSYDIANNKFTAIQDYL